MVRLNTLDIIPCRNWTQGRTWENLSSEEKEQFLEEVLGSEHKYGNVQVWFPSILYPIISLLGIPGNLLTCLSIYKIPYMRTPSNFFIFNLALSDLLSLSFGNHKLFSLNDVKQIVKLLMWHSSPILFILCTFSSSNGSISNLDKLPDTSRKDWVQFSYSGIRVVHLCVSSNTNHIYNRKVNYN